MSDDQPAPRPDAPTDQPTDDPAHDLSDDPPIGVVSVRDNLALVVGDTTKTGEWIQYDGPTVNVG